MEKVMMKLTSMFKKKKQPVSGFKFGGRSKQKLEDVHPDLVAVFERALQLSTVDFGITCGLRTQHEQNQLRAKGKSQVKVSRHQTGHAIDVVCYVGGKVTWDFEYYGRVADAVALAAKELDVSVVWGAAWLAPLNSYEDAFEAKGTYVALRKSQGRKPFIDGPHFELNKEEYPS
jgi:peptidoglycan L-alanyl-D-glutamate endopeptidase CwlK